MSQAVKTGAASIVGFGAAIDQAEELFFKDDEARFHLPILILGWRPSPKQGLIQDGKDLLPEALFSAHYDWIESAAAPAAKPVATEVAGETENCLTLSENP